MVMDKCCIFPRTPGLCFSVLEVEQELKCGRTEPLTTLLWDVFMYGCLCPPGNKLAEIQPSAFDSLWSLEELDLSNNQLTALKQKWFRNMGALQKLNLLDNPYR